VAGPVLVISTGGTIAMRPDPASGKLVPAISGEELLELIAWPFEAPTLELDEFAHVPSFDMHGELALALARRVVEHAHRTDIAGIVITHGTDTMEESAFMIDRLLDSDTAVVLTGAQRGADQADSDGPRNLRDAIRVALAAEARGRGAMIAFAGSLHAAREGRKLHTSALAAFGSPGYGPIGHVEGATVVFRRRPDRRPPLAAPKTLAPVDLIRLYAGSDGRFLRTAVESGTRAVVLECTGRGNANATVVAGVREAVEAGVSVIVCSRCVEGSVEPVYGAGGGRDLADAGALFAGDLAGPKARVLLQLALGAGLTAAGAIEADAA
jgi:L-asparaginase